MARMTNPLRLLGGKVDHVPGTIINLPEDHAEQEAKAQEMQRLKTVAQAAQMHLWAHNCAERRRAYGEALEELARFAGDSDMLAFALDLQAR